MRTIQFIVNGQDISLDPKCDTDGLVPGSSGYIQAEFKFSKEWTGCAKVVGFYSNLGREFPPQELKDGASCLIPPEALAKSIFKVKVFGKKGNYALCTNKITIYQKGGNL